MFPTSSQHSTVQHGDDGVLTPRTSSRNTCIIDAGSDCLTLRMLSSVADMRPSKPMRAWQEPHARTVLHTHTHIDVSCDARQAHEWHARIRCQRVYSVPKHSARTFQSRTVRRGRSTTSTLNARICGTATQAGSRRRRRHTISTRSRTPVALYTPRNSSCPRSTSPAPAM